MRKLILAALLLPGTALANNTTINGPAYFNQPNTASASANATGGAGGAGGSASAGASAGSSSASQTSRIVVAPALPGMASGPCTGPGGGVSFGVVGFAGGAGYTSMDKGCDARETARPARCRPITRAAASERARHKRRGRGAGGATSG